MITPSVCSNWRSEEAFLPKRFVRNGKIITAAGVSAGLDMALYLAGEIAGKPMAQAIQLGLENVVSRGGSLPPPWGWVVWLRAKISRAPFVIGCHILPFAPIEQTCYTANKRTQALSEEQSTQPTK